MKSGKADLSDKLRREAVERGLDVIGFADASPFRDYLLKNSSRRDPSLSLVDARTIVVAGVYIGGMALPSWDKPSHGRTSRLYLSGYFLDVVEPMEPLAGVLKAEGFSAKVCDSGARGGSIVPLKLAAIRAGLGWQGRQSLLVSKKYGTFLALGGILTNAELEHNTQEEKNRCKNCRLCLEACPVNALETPFVLDYGACLSYLLQIKPLPGEAKAVMGNRVGDCEICQQACPWNRKHIKNPLETPRTIAFRERIPAWEDFFQLSNLAGLTEEEYKKTIVPLGTEISYSIFMRNVEIANENRTISNSHE